MISLINNFLLPAANIKTSFGMDSHILKDYFAIKDLFLSSFKFYFPMVLIYYMSFWNIH